MNAAAPLQACRRAPEERKRQADHMEKISAPHSLKPKGKAGEEMPGDVDSSPAGVEDA
jgi:hypothetical protein